MELEAFALSEHPMIRVFIKRSEKRRTWSLSVKPGGEVELSVPAQMTPDKIGEILRKHQAWIQRRHTKLAKHPRIDLSHGWGEGESFYYQGSSLTLNLRRSHYSHVVLEGDRLVVSSPDFRARAIKGTVETWLEEKTYIEAVNFFTKWSPRFGLKQNPDLRLRLLRRSWGLCRSDGRITLHKYLSRLHPEFFEYVLVHELCHIFHMNHGPHFKALLSDKIPNWKEIKKKHEPILY